MEWNLKGAYALKSLAFDAGFFVILSLFALIFWKRMRWKFKLLFLPIVLALFAFSVSPIGFSGMYEGLLMQWEQKIKDESQQEGQCSILPPVWVVLGGGSFHGQIPMPSPSSMDRILYTAELFKNQSPDAPPQVILFSGGVWPGSETASEAKIMATYFEIFTKGMSLAPTEIQLEENSLNTAQNGLFVKEWFEKASVPKKILLITSDFHQPRSIGVFKKLGFEVCSRGPLSSFLQGPQGFGFKFQYGTYTVLMLNEWLGTLGYWYKGWI